MKSPQERREQLRQERLEEMERQVRSGSLVIRKMTKAERERYQANAREPRPRRT